MFGVNVRTIAILFFTALLTGCDSGGGGGGAVVTIASSAITLYANLGKFAGAVSSIKWMGHELVNANDHGRLWQTALQIDGYGECFNPTEAGASLDRKSSSSKLLAHSTDSSNRILATQVAAAYWTINPASNTSCPQGNAPGVTSQPSDVIIGKRVEVGALGNQNIIEWRVEVKAARAQKRMGIEILTGYLPPEFDRAFTYTRNGELSEVFGWGPVPGYPGADMVQASNYDKLRPIIFIKDGGACAVSVWRPTATIKPCEATANELLKFNGGESPCSKFSVVTHAPVSCIGNNANFVVYAAIGSLGMVHDILKKHAV